MVDKYLNLRAPQDLVTWLTKFISQWTFFYYNAVYFLVVLCFNGVKYILGLQMVVLEKAGKSSKSYPSFCTFTPNFNSIQFNSVMLCRGWKTTIWSVSWCDWGNYPYLIQLFSAHYHIIRLYHYHLKDLEWICFKSVFQFGHYWSLKNIKQDWCKWTY